MSSMQVEDRELQAVNSRTHEDPPYPSPGYAWYVVGVLMIVYVLSFIDRQILSMIVDPIKKDLNVNDEQMGLLMGFSFALFYSILGVPFGWLADRKNRRAIIIGGVAFWSLFTAACGVVHQYWQLFLLRMGVGIGEATLSPAAYSIITDYFPRHRLATAISVYGMGIYVGTGMAYLLGGLVAQYALTSSGLELPVFGEVHPWQAVFLIVGLPGLLIAALVFSIKEPLRRGLGGVGQVGFGEFLGYVKSNASSFLLHNIGFALLAFMGYACAQWLPTFFIRVHEWDRQSIGLWYGFIVMIFGSAGIVYGGVLADFLSRRGYRDAKIRVGVFSAVISIPFVIAFPMVSDGTVAMLLLIPLTFAGAMPFGCAPAAVQEMVPSSMRGQAGAVYLLIVNIISIGCAAPVVGAITTRIFQDDNAVGYSLMSANIAACVIALVLLTLALRPFVKTVDRLRGNA